MAKKELKLFKRFTTKRIPINRFGKLGFRKFEQMLITDEEQIYAYNKGKKIKFECVGNVFESSTLEQLVPFLARESKEEMTTEAYNEWVDYVISELQQGLMTDSIFERGVENDN